MQVVDRLVLDHVHDVRPPLVDLVDALDLDAVAAQDLVGSGGGDQLVAHRLELVADEIDRLFKEADSRSMEEMWDGLPGGESFRAFHDRVVTGLAETLDSHGIHPMHPDHRHLWAVDDPDKRVVIVAHAGTNAVVLGHLLGLDPVPWEWERFRQPHTGVSRLTMIQISTGWAFSLRQLGNVAHLHPGMVTA